MQKRNILNSPRLLELKKHRRNVFLAKISIFLLTLVGIFTLLAHISRLEQLNIKDVEIGGNKVVSAETIKSIVEERITGNYLKFFPKTNILYYPKKSISTEIQNQFQRIKNVNFAIKGDKTLEVSVTERTGIYTWCGDVQSKDVKEKQICYFMDDSGYIFDEAPYFSGEVYFKFYGSLNLSNENPLGSYFSLENFNRLITFKNTLEGIGLKPVALYTERDGNTRISLSGKNLPFEPEVIFKMESDLEAVAGNLEAALRTEPLLSEFKNKYSSLLYIDLRFGNKVYYKFQ